MGPLKLLRVTSRVAVLSTPYKLKHLDIPCGLPKVRTLPSRARAIARHKVDGMLATCDD